MTDVNQTLESREKTHGDYKDVAEAAQTIKNTFQFLTNENDSKLSPVQLESLDMFASKLARIFCGNPNEPDHWHDIAGYATLVEKELHREFMRELRIEERKCDDSII